MALDQGVILQRLFADVGDDAALIEGKAGVHSLSAKITRAFRATGAMLTQSNEPKLAQHLAIIKGHYQTFEAHGLKLVQAREVQDRVAFDDLLDTLNNRQDAINTSIADLHDHMALVTDAAIVHADREEQNLLVVNSVLTAVAAFLALLFALIVTRLIVRAVRNLAAGAEAVENGDLDTEVSVTSDDEVGKLTHTFNDMVGGLRLKERIKDTFGKYMDPRIVSGLLDNPEFSQPGGERREMSVMFIDLKGFTSISEVLEPDELVEMVNSFFGHMTDAISQNNGVVDKYMGDAVMAYWGPPFCAAQDHARLACKAATEALDKLETFRADVHAKLGNEAEKLDIDLRIGVSSGDMIVGTIGSKASRNFTVMGDPVNLGSRLEGASKAYGTRVLISERTRELADPEIPMREIDLIRVKGKKKPIRVYELLTGKAPAPSLDVGLAAYRAQDWAAAEEAFCKDQNDSASLVYLDRIIQLRQNPPPPGWDGVWVFETK